MPKVLIVSYHYPPRNTVASLRPYYLAKYLPHFGWFTEILCSNPSGDKPSIFHKLFGISSNQNILPQVQQLKKKLHGLPIELPLKAYGEFSAYPDTTKSWFRQAFARGLELVKGCDAIISTSNFTSHIVASELSWETATPWIADFQDLWTQNHYYQWSPLRKWFETKLELNTIGLAQAITTISEGCAQKLRGLHWQKVHSIPIGYNPEEVRIGNGNFNFTISYTGNIYPKMQDISSFIDALSQIELKTMMRFVGTMPDINKKLAQHSVEIYSPVKRDIALNIQKNSSALLLLRWNDPKETGVIPSKLYEYMAARRPIISIGRYHDESCDIIEETNCGFNCYDSTQVRNAIESIINGKEFRYDIEKYSCVKSAEKFAQVLNEVTGVGK